MNGRRQNVVVAAKFKQNFYLFSTHNNNNTQRATGYYYRFFFSSIFMLDLFGQNILLDHFGQRDFTSYLSRTLDNFDSCCLICYLLCAVAV